MKKKTITLITGIVVSGVSGGLIYNYRTGKEQGVWDGQLGGSFLGRDFGITGALAVGGDGAAAPGAGVRDAYGLGVVADLDALRACKVRTEDDLDLFMKRLKKPLNQQPEAESKSLHYPSS
ncbi:MAG: hypothetical protein H0U75_07785 [Legionella sp.]|nr:hypothetical protein [Legionella sp.]